MRLEDFFSENPCVALGFSGGTDSAYLLYAGKRFGAHIHAYYVKTAFQPQFELADARRMAEALGTALTVIESDILNVPNVSDNPPNRCYYCKTAIFSLIRSRAAADGFSVLIDGTNASDDVCDRPGMRALGELAVRSPLRECEITKDEVRNASREAGLFTWDKPAYACLATRIPTGEKITGEMLSRIENAENVLFGMGFSDFRVRLLGNAARLQLKAEDMPRALSQREQITAALSDMFSAVLLDLKSR